MRSPLRSPLARFAGCVALGVAAAAAAEPAADKSAPLILRVPRPEGTEWFGLYVLGKKAGWASNEIKADAFEGRPAVLAVSETVLGAKVGTTQSERRIREERYYEAKDGGRLLAFRIDKRGDGGDEVLAGRCSDKGIELTRVRPGQPEEKRKLPPTGEVLEAADVARIVAATRKDVEGKLLDPYDLKDTTTRTTWLGEGTYVAAGVAVKVARVKTVDDKDKVPVVASLEVSGRLLEMKFGEVMAARLETEEVAKKLDQLDMFTATRVTLAKAPPKAREVPRTLVWRVAGMDETFYVTSGRQSVAKQADGTALVTVRAAGPDPKLAAKARRPLAEAKGELAEALESTLSIEADDPKVKALAKQLVGDVPDAWAASKRLALFVNKYLTKTYGTSNDRCTGVLEAKKGDCTEHALLFTCLARSAGIPARRVDGLVYMDNGDGVAALYWHEWAEVWVGQWIPVDPTFNEPVADATHIALGGEGSAQSAGLIGQLKIEVAGP